MSGIKWRDVAAPRLGRVLMLSDYRQPDPVRFHATTIYGIGRYGSECAIYEAVMNRIGLIEITRDGIPAHVCAGVRAANRWLTLEVEDERNERAEPAQLYST